eukprot:TRINITY_DN10030_c0_g2_i1.p2 TRINITY_DN10030_c0_g2~~TRINITY_DN10030_c0_g2_i1.p2  ORF type:complete len:540 (-),score=161.78 TRINITY_DN10030_c0_g2_i1:613-2025(-)
MDNVALTMPLIYTPTVGLACQQFGPIWRQPRGLFISRQDRGSVADLLDNWPEDDVRVIVITDGERILGLGDLGANGMGIPIGKISLYVACAGIPPHLTLPITLDVGCDTMSIRDDPLYIGTQEPRLRGQPYMDLVDEVVDAVRAKWPRALLQWEDFATDNAFVLLNRHRRRICSFNDDVQGTATVVLAAVESACKVTGRPLPEQRILFFGAGSSAVGVGDLISGAVYRQMEGTITEAQARERCFYVDTNGLVCYARTKEGGGGGKGLREHKMPYCHKVEWAKDLMSSLDTVKPTVLIGLSTTGGAFDEAVVKKMSELNEKPVIFALSNPTSKAECTAQQAYEWSDGRALFACGSPFDNVVVNGKEHRPRQANNAYIFPGMGLGIVLSGASWVPDDLMHAAAKACADAVPEEELTEHGALCPPLDSIRSVSTKVAVAVVRAAQKAGVATVDLPADDELEAWITAQQYNPHP